MSAKRAFSALVCGVIFGVGLCVSGMTDPKNVLAFLDVAGHWSPNLAGVMLGAIAVHAVWLRITGEAKPIRVGVDAPLIAGAAIFGVGWGLAGYCPGPVIVSLGSGALGVIVFVVAMELGMLLVDAIRGLSPTQEKTTSAAE